MIYIKLELVYFLVVNKLMIIRLVESVGEFDIAFYRMRMMYQSSELCVPVTAVWLIMTVGSSRRGIGDRH